MKKFMLPAEYVIHCFKGVRPTARAIGRDPSSVSKWRTDRDHKGTGGQIPASAHLLILKAAEERGIDLTPNDLLLGRMVGDNG